ncbi:MAG: TonB-dependent receptor [Gammaproteobacteria bacterium]|nr:TonB-dependent receptor [Gammaproteobacteria bacterium]
MKQPPLIAMTQAMLFGGLLLSFVQPFSKTFAAAVDEVESFLDLSFEELSQVVITSASRKAQTLADTAAAVFVISADDIRRSGATNLPEALRLAPGVQVAALGNNKWAISIRGFADRYSNKLLVLMDGRTLYSSMLSGVFWEAQNIPLENIEHIEVIRGPAPLWGANAVNGVINIITKSTEETLGGQAVVATGTELRAEGFVRQGWKINDDTAMRVYAKAQDYGSSQMVAGGQNADDWQNERAGFRLEHAQGMDQWLVEGEVYHNQAGDRILLPLPTGLNALKNFDQRMHAGYLLSRWKRQISATDEYSLQAYFEHQSLEHVWLTQDTDTLDMEFQQQLAIGDTQDIIWGLGYRHTRDDITGSVYLTINPAQRTSRLFSAYFQDEITLIPNRWHLTLGSRFEHNDYTGFEVQPNLRLLWMPDPRNRIWAAVSRVVRTPSRGESDGRAWLINTPVGALGKPLPPLIDPNRPVAIIWQGNPDLQAEKMIGLDIGWRHQWPSALNLDLAGFYYNYDELRNFSAGALDFSNPPLLTLPFLGGNTGSAKIHGLELTANWQPFADWRLQASYSYSRVRWPNHIGGGGIPPIHQFSLLSSWTFHPAWRGDAWLRHVSEIEDPTIPAYTSLDIQLAWKIQRDLEISLVGQNLLEQTHLEYASEQFLRSIPTEIERGIYLKLNAQF